MVSLRSGDEEEPKSKEMLLGKQRKQIAAKHWQITDKSAVSACYAYWLILETFSYFPAEKIMRIFSQKIQ